MAIKVSLLGLAMHPAMVRSRGCRLREAAIKAVSSCDAEDKWAVEDYAEQDFKWVHGRWPTEDELQARVTQDQLVALTNSATESLAGDGVVHNCQPKSMDA